jgi:rhodanese-related sulfurtransferase
MCYFSSPPRRGRGCRGGEFTPPWKCPLDAGNFGEEFTRRDTREAISELAKIVRGIIVIIGLGVVIGGAVNFPLLRRFAAGEFREGFIDSRKYEGIRFISLAETQDLFAQKMRGADGLLFIDSRSRSDFAAGHIPGALSVPLDEVESSGKKRAGANRPGSLDFPGANSLVVYCEGGDCQTSIALARLIHDKGYRDIRIFSGGWGEWEASGLPEEKSP